MITRIRVLVIAVALLLAVMPRPEASAAAKTGPTLVVTPNTVTIGQTVSVEAIGFPVDTPVVVTLCGNQARRGSIDCDLGGSVGFPIRRQDERHVVPFVIGTPPVHCPCVIEASNTPKADIAYAPITITGFPVGPVEGDDFFKPLDLQVDVHRASQNPIAWLRSFVGGPTAYKVEVTLHNRSSQRIDGVTLVARAGRHANDQARRVVLQSPKSLGGGETRRYSKRVTLSAPVIGGFVWTVTATGDAALAKSVVNTSHQPWGLYVLLVALVGDLAWWGWRRVRKLRGYVESEYAHEPEPEVNGDETEPVQAASPPAGHAESLLTRPRDD